MAVEDRDENVESGPVAERQTPAGLETFTGWKMT